MFTSNKIFSFSSIFGIVVINYRYYYYGRNLNLAWKSDFSMDKIIAATSNTISFLFHGFSFVHN